MYKASIIITAYQAENTIGRAIRSVLDSPRKNEIEIIVVDDCSRDGTAAIVEDFCRENDNIRYLCMPSNTGGPSAPRNRGIAEATGEYISFLDDDDYYDMDGYFKMLDTAAEQNADYIKGYLIVHEGSREYEANRLYSLPKPGAETIRDTISKLSTNGFIVKRDLVIDHSIAFDASLKIGEDTVFVTDILSHSIQAIYVDVPFFHYIKTVDTGNLSSTQHWSDREISDQLDSWRRSEANLQRIGLSYYDLRLSDGFRNLMLSIVRFPGEISESCYAKMSTFAVQTKKNISNQLLLAPRYQELYDSILSGNYQLFCDTKRQRLLIAGFDLKFILPLVPYFEKQYAVQVDEWTGHNAHDEKKSKKLLKWADIIWCEWLLGNAVFFAQHKATFQRLVIRAHRFEVTREFGKYVNYAKVDAVFTVSYYFMELFSEQFSIPRKKMKLLSNYIESDIYRDVRGKGSPFDLGIVGILPARKGYMRALELLELLRRKDKRYVLHVCGQLPQQVEWIWKDQKEKNYYEACSRYIEEHGLTDAVILEGFKPRNKLYEGIGIVLSMSDDERVPESFHLAPAEGACAGAMGLFLHWRGAEYIYPQDVLFNNISEIAEEIEAMSASEQYYTERQRTFETYVRRNYNIDTFMQTLMKYLQQVAQNG